MLWGGWKAKEGTKCVRRRLVIGFQEPNMRARFGLDLAVGADGTFIVFPMYPTVIMFSHVV